MFQHESKGSDRSARGVIQTQEDLFIYPASVFYLFDHIKKKGGDFVCTQVVFKLRAREHSLIVSATRL